MTQEERYTKTLQVLSNYKSNIELKTYQEEKDNIVNELNSIKEQINNTKNSYKVDLIELQTNRNRLLKIEKDINNANSSEENIDIEKLNNEKEQITNWFNEQENLKNSSNNNLLELLNKQEEIQKQLIIIESHINNFHKNHTPTEESFDSNNTIDALNNMESLYNTEEFNEEEYKSLKEQFINEQLLIDSLIEQAEINLNNSKTSYDEILNNSENIKANLNKNELRNLNNEIKNYEREYNIWNEVLENIKSMKIEHEFIDENVVQEEIDNALDDLEIEEEKEQDNAIDNIEFGNEEDNSIVIDPVKEEQDEIEPISLTDMYNNDEEVEEETAEEQDNKLSIKQEEEPRTTQLSQEEYNKIMKTIGLFINGDVTIEGDINVTIKNYIPKDEKSIEKDIDENNLEIEENNKDINKDEIIFDSEEPKVENNNIEETSIDDEPEENTNIESLKIDITNNKEAREKISNTNKNLKRIKKAINSNLIQQEEGIDEIDNLIQKEHQEINNIINNYYEIKDNIESILEDKNKCNELTKIALDKVDELEELSEYDIKLLNDIDYNDYSNIIIKLINIMQYDKTINEIINENSIENDSIKTK